MNYMYGALLLHKQGKDINLENMKKVIEATGGEVDVTKINVLVESLKGVDIDKELEQANVVAAAPVSGEASESKEKAEEKKEEKAEEAAEGLSALFG